MNANIDYSNEVLMKLFIIDGQCDQIIARTCRKFNQIYPELTPMNKRLRLLVSFFKFPNLFSCISDDDIISDDSLEAVREIVAALRTNIQIIGHGWIFRGEAALQRGIVQDIVEAIEKGNLMNLRNLLDAGWRLEASQALYTFLTRLSQPLVPYSIQSLVLDDNGNVPVEMVATDVLGLMKQELTERHFQLASVILNLLDTVIKVSPADELRGNTLPISMLPFFFNIQSQHINEWRRIATIFVELIRQASQRLEPENNVSEATTTV